MPGKTAGPTPVVVFFHGGGFRLGDKSSVPGWLVANCLNEGISVASANYRLSTTATFPAPMVDGARRHPVPAFPVEGIGARPGPDGRLGEFGRRGDRPLDRVPRRPGRSASPDPIARLLTRLTCVGVDGAQTSYDPRFIQQVIGGRAHEHSALPSFYGLTDSERDTPRAHTLYEAASPINHATTGDPPVILFYMEPDGPLPADAKPGQGIHHPRFGTALEAKLDSLGIECIVRHASAFPEPEDPNPKMFQEMTAFFARHLLVPRDRVARVGALRGRMRQA